MGHAIMHNFGREVQTDSIIYQASEIRPGASSVVPSAGAIQTDTKSVSGFTTLIQTVEIAITQPATTVTATSIRTNVVTDEASFASLLASETSSEPKTTQAESTTSAVASETSKAATGSSPSSNLNTLIPAIVVPVAVVLVLSFALFWFMMRRKHKKEIKKQSSYTPPSKIEKPTLSRGNSHSSGHSSTRELVPMSKLEKEVAITTNDTKPTSNEFSLPKYSSTEIGVARPMTPPDRTDNKDGARRVPNFSSPRPSSSDRRFGSPAGSRTIPHSALKSVGHSSPPKSIVNSSSTAGDARGPPQRPRRPDETIPSPGARSPPRTAPQPLNTKSNSAKRAPPPPALNPPTPTGAFNGASPISQYSPIIKGHVNLGAATGFEPSMPDQHRKKQSDENGFSVENLRVARLADSSRFDFDTNNTNDVNFSRGVAGNKMSLEKTKSATTTSISPRLPPPLTWDDRPPKLFAKGPDSPAGGSSIYPSPSIGADATPRIGMEQSNTKARNNPVDTVSASEHPHRVSAVSGISSDDEYVDMEMDDKSDVSSLDEREKWELEKDRQEAASRLDTIYTGGGYGSTSASPIDGPGGPSPVSTTGAKPNIRDRDSEGPFVLSRY